MKKDLSYYEKIIQEKRKKSPFREFLKEIASWSPLMYYKNNDTTSIFPQGERIQDIVTPKIFEESRNNLIGIPIKSVPTGFFKSLSLLQKKVPFPCVRQYGSCDNALYTDTNSNIADSYLVRCSTTCERVAYSLVIKKTQDVYGSIKVQGGEGDIYQSFSIDRTARIFYSQCIEDSSDIWFSHNLKNCHECIFCSGRENTSYAIKNQIYKKEEYYSKKKEILEQKSKFSEWDSLFHGHSFSNRDCENIENIFGGTHVIGGRNALIVGNPVGTKNIYDTLCTGTIGDYYGATDCGVNSEYIYCSVAIVSSSQVYYSHFLENCHHCLGCIGLKNRSYCILNQEYSKEEWEVKVCEIFASMETDGTLGAFFPASMNPFYFNDTLAFLIDDSFTKEEIVKEGYLWRDDTIRADIPEGMRIIKNTELSQFQGFNMDGFWEINPEITQLIIMDEDGNFYTILKMEYDFLVKHGLPLPTQHWLKRIKKGFR